MLLTNLNVIVSIKPIYGEFCSVSLYAKLRVHEAVSVTSLRRYISVTSFNLQCASEDMFKAKGLVILTDH